MKKGEVISSTDPIWGQFGKGTKTQVKLTRNAVIYTRVSGKKQEDGYSLDRQLRECTEYANKNEHVVLGCFGGRFESAQTDVERKEFNKMLDFVRKSKEKISWILVLSSDRFSRTGPNAIYLAEQLRSMDVQILSILQPTDTTTSAGRLQQNIQFVFSHYENELRREKCSEGVIDALLDGKWCSTLPIGYKRVTGDGETQVIVSAKGKLLRKAFMWKYNEGISNEEARQRLVKLGLDIPRQTLSRVFRNPFYCGLISNKLLQGRLVEGKHEKLVTRKIFLKVNNIQAENHHGYNHNSENEALPLKGTLKCAGCGSNMTGYIVRKKGLYYYKCRGIGCGNNKSAKQLNSRFSAILDRMHLPEGLHDLLKAQMERTYNQQSNELKENEGLMKRKLTEIRQKIERIEERFILEEIDATLYQKFSAKYRKEEAEIEVELEKTGTRVSNLEKCVEMALEYVLNLPSLWESSTFTGKQRLQKIVFPTGIHYHRKTEGCRTERINGVFLQSALLTQIAAGKKTGIPELGIEYARLVELVGVEPTSKQGINMLSTSLALRLIFDCVLPGSRPHTT